MENNMLHCGKIVNTHGIAGDVKVLYYTDNADFFRNIKQVYLNGGAALELCSFKPHKGTLIMHFKSIDTANDAEKLCGCDIYVPRDKAPKLPDGRYYISDIIGMSVITRGGRMLGKVTDVFKTGSNDVYEVKNENGKEYLIPVIDEVVLDIDLASGTILIEPLEGLIEDEN